MSVMLLQEREGFRDFDLGGVNDRDAAGVKAFKAGLGGDRGSAGRAVSVTCAQPISGTEGSKRRVE